MSKWTPGPWVAHRTFHEYVVPAEDADKKIGATVNEWERHEFARIVHHSYPGLPDAAANARLIAAAPEMAELLLELYEHLEYCGWGDRYEREGAIDAKLPERARAILARLEAE